MNDAEFLSRLAAIPTPSGSHPRHSWLANRIALHTIATPNSFLSTPTIHNTMWVGDGEIVRGEYAELQSTHPDLLVHATHSGPFPLPGRTIDNLDPNLIHQLYHLTRHPLHASLSTLSTITEFGGGYGAMALLCNRLGFTGTYYLYDLPEFLLLQEYYLSHHPLNCTVVYGATAPSDLFIACHSLTEAPLSSRYVADSHRAYLIAGLSQWFGYNNTDYLHDLMSANPMTWEIRGAYTLGYHDDSN